MAYIEFLQTDDNDWSDIRKIQCISECEDRFSLRPKIRGELTNRRVSPSENTLNSSSQTLTRELLIFS